MIEAHDDRPRFRPEAPPSRAPRGQLALMVLLMLSTGAALLLRPLWEPGVPEGILVEVSGEVPHPGTYLLEQPTVAAAVEAAGGDASAFESTPVPAGHRVVVDAGGAHTAPPSDPLLVALPVDLNQASAEALTAIPGLGPTLAEAIVSERANAPYAELDDVLRVPGVGPTTLELLRPFVVLEPVALEPLDLNRATAAELERLPGIGPVTAARIVVDREDHGPFERLEDLARVRGVGTATIEALREHVTVR